MAEISTSDVVLRLVMKNMDPAEATRLASQSVAAIEAELKASLTRQAEAHRKAAEAQTKEAQKSANEEIKAAEKASKGLIQAQRAVAAEAKKAAGESSTHWRRLLEDMENITVVAEGMHKGMEAIFGKFKELSEEVIRTSKIFGSLKSSIDSARESTEGTVSDMDLIIAKNRALELELKLTDHEFGTVAASASAFADATGGDTAEALNTLIQGLATGRVKLLEHAGIVVDLDQAYGKFADSIGKSVSQLTDEEKRSALVTASLEKMEDKIAAAGTTALTIGKALEQFFTSSKNIWDNLIAAIGNAKIPKWLQFVSGGLTGGEEFSDADLKAMLETGAAPAAQKMIAAREAAKAAAQESLRRRLIEQTGGEDLVGNGAPDWMIGVGENNYDPNPTSRLSGSQVGGRILGGEKINNNISYASPSAMDMFGGDVTALLASKRASNESDILDKIRKEADEEAEKIQEKAERDAEHQRERNRELINGLIDDMAKEEAAYMEKLGQTNQKAGGGLLARLLFGPDGPDKTYEQMDEFSKFVVDAAGSVSQAADGMAQAYGSAFAAWAQGEKGFRAALAESTRAVVRDIATQAATHAIMEGALGLASLALGPIGGISAAQHFAAAAAFGGVAVTAGAALRALGPSPSIAAAASRATTPRTPDFTSSGRSTGQTSGETKPVIINVSVFPGGEQAAGDAIVKALEARKAQTGRGIEHLMS